MLIVLPTVMLMNLYIMLIIKIVIISITILNIVFLPDKQLVLHRTPAGVLIRSLFVTIDLSIIHVSRDK